MDAGRITGRNAMTPSNKAITVSTSLVKRSKKVFLIALMSIRRLRTAFRVTRISSGARPFPRGRSTQPRSAPVLGAVRQVLVHLPGFHDEYGAGGRVDVLQRV